MHRRAILSICLGILVFNSYRTDASQQPSTTHTAALSPVIAAHGGVALSAIQTIRLVGQSNRFATGEKIVISATVDGRIRFDYGDPVTYSVVRGIRAPFDVNGGKLVPKQPHTDVFAQLDLLAPLAVIEYDGANPVITTQGNTQSGTMIAQRFQIQTTNQKTFYSRPVSDVVSIDVDPQKSVILGINRLQFAEEDLNNSFTLSYTFSDHRSVNGVLLPFQIRKYINGIVRETISIDSIDLNPAIPPDLFMR